MHGQTPSAPVNLERFRQFGFVDLKRPTLLTNQTSLERSSFLKQNNITENWQTIDKRVLTLYPIGWSADLSDGLQLDFFGVETKIELPYEFYFSLQNIRVVQFISAGLNRIMTPARFLIGARNAPVVTPIIMEPVALAGSLVPRLELDLSRTVRPKKEPYRKPKWR